MIPQPLTDSNGKEHIIQITPYKLPFVTEMSEAELHLIGGAEKMSKMQGFYIYRGKRLLLAGDWLGLFRKEEHYKLARIRIDLPNTQDDLWQIDIKKSTARPPIAYINQLKRI